MLTEVEQCMRENLASNRLESIAYSLQVQISMVHYYSVYKQYFMCVCVCLHTDVCMYS